MKISAGLVYRLNPTNVTINLPKSQNQILYIVVENMGRLNYGNDMLDSKVRFCLHRDINLLVEIDIFHLIKKLGYSIGCDLGRSSAQELAHVYH